jgi:hypothetical protein
MRGLVIFLSWTLVLVMVACTSSPEKSSIATPSSSASPIIAPTNTEASSTSTDLATVRQVVEAFGKRLQQVSLQSPNVAEEMQGAYSPYVSDDLLALWLSDLSQAPGRFVSSPWPDRIEIVSLTQEAPDRFRVTGFIVEVTSMELVKGGAASKVPVALTIQKEQGHWLITEFVQGSRVFPKSAANSISPTLQVIGPSLFPTPSDTVTTWAELLQHPSLEALSWEEHRGQFSRKAILIDYSFQYPTGWLLFEDPAAGHVFVQNIPLSAKPPDTDFLKFEILLLESPPSVESILPPENYKTVLIAGHPAILEFRPILPGKAISVSATLEQDGYWILLGGYANLKDQNMEELDISTNILLNIISTFSLKHQP